MDLIYPPVYTASVTVREGVLSLAHQHSYSRLGHRMFKRLFLLATLSFSSQALAEDREKWEGVYERADKRIEVGEWMGIGGGAAVGAGVVMFTMGIAQSDESLGSGSYGDAGGNFLFATSGISVAGTGFAAFALGPTLTASGSIRQAKS